MAVFIGAALSDAPGFPPLHPLGNARQKRVRDLCAALGWLDERDVVRPPQAPLDTLLRFHDPAYVDALRAASESGQVSAAVRERYRFGTMENPVFAGLFERAATTVGGSILAANRAMGGQVAFHPAGGTHHGRPDRAAGFCYFNDPVFAILTLLDAGVDRVGYVDLDAHHGDGVQDAFSADPRVVCVSVHEAGRWPGTGALTDRAATGLARNAPVPRGLNDSEFARLLCEGVMTHLRAQGVQALVITCGVDGLAGDPLSAMALSNGALWQGVLSLCEAWPVAVVLGGGGYNPWTTTRGWAGLWARLSGQAIPDTLPPAATQLLQGLSSDLVDEDDIQPFWLVSVADPPHSGPVRPEIDAILKAWA